MMKTTNRTLIHQPWQIRSSVCFRSNISFQDVNVHGPTQGAEQFLRLCFGVCVWAVLSHMAHMAVLLGC